MESKCSRQSLRNEDRLSHLPNALLLKILSSLPTKNVVATSVLSKQWRHLWKMVPKLEFTYQPTGGFYLANNLDLQRFSDIVRRSMLSLQAPVQSLHLNVIAGGCDYGFNFGVLVGIALGLHVRELVLHFELSHSFRFPISHCETLETLKLRSRRHSIILHVPSPVCLESLRTLHLEDVLYEDDESVRNLLSGCISLENLVVSRSGRDRVETFTVAVPSLQRLIITEVGYGDSVYVINAPSLKYLEMIGNNDHPGSCLIENAPELVEAYIQISKLILGSLTSVKHLTLTISHLEVPAGSIFNQLVYLKLCTCELESWNSLMLMLDNSPNLQVLEILSDDRVPSIQWKEPKHVPQCLLHLKTVDWYVHGMGYGKEAAEYILRNLKKAVLRLEIADLTTFTEEERHEVQSAMERWCPDDCEFELVA